MEEEIRDNGSSRRSVSGYEYKHKWECERRKFDFMEMYRIKKLKAQINRTRKTNGRK